jgi:hypothetical protein
MRPLDSGASTQQWARTLARGSRRRRRPDSLPSGRVHWQGAQDGATGPIPFPVMNTSSVGQSDGDGPHYLSCGVEKRKGESVLGFGGEGESSVLFEPKSRATVGSR